MNEENNNADDAELLNVFRNVREIAVPANLRDKCFVAAQEGLAINDAAKPAKQHSANLRFSAAIAASLLAGVGLGWVMRGSTRPTDGATTQTPIKQTASTPSAGVNATSAIALEDRDPEESFFTEEIYLCGVGRIQSKVTLFANGDSQ